MISCDFWLVLLKKWIQVLVFIFGFFTKVIPWTFLFKMERIHYFFFCSLTCLLIDQRLLYPWRLSSVLFMSSNSLLNTTAQFTSCCCLSEGGVLGFFFCIRLVDTVPSVGIFLLEQTVCLEWGWGVWIKKRKEKSIRETFSIVLGF